jgi:hypothetical protein
VRWTGPLFALFSLALLPWTIYIAGSLPAQQVSANYDAAWAGFDVLLMRRGPRRGVRPKLVASAAAGSPAEPAPSAAGPVP